jgi:formamidopyrimidine-DNA glycosylase
MSLAESQVISNQLQSTAVGKTIVKTIVNQNPHSFVWFATEPRYAYAAKEVSNKQAEQYDALLVGKKILNSNVLSNYNYLYIGNRALMFNTLSTRYYRANEKQPKRHQLYLLLDDGTALAFCGSLGGPLFLFEVDEDGWAVSWRNNFPSILSEDFTETFFLDLIKNTDLTKLQPAKSVKCFLATKNRIPGIDNVILHEILWEAQVNPKSVMAAIGQDEYKRLYAAIKKVFPAVITAGGLDTQKDIYGNFGGYVTKASRNTLGKPCKRCGEPIVKEAYMGGVVYYCPKCQPIINRGNK